MITHTIKVRERTMSVDKRVVVANSVGCDALSLDLDDEWDGLAVVVIVDGKAATWTGEPIELPTMTEAGFVAVSIVGMAPDCGVRMVTEKNDRILLVVESGDTGEAMVNGIAMV